MTMGGSLYRVEVAFPIRAGWYARVRRWGSCRRFVCLIEDHRWKSVAGAAAGAGSPRSAVGFPGTGHPGAGRGNRTHPVGRAVAGG
ncbi:hypothetical protein UG55_101839 [Frankia sp. EI5c]|nr:hypothetical protein UG55_101839 [Frankia sp. EI5c]